MKKLTIILSAVLVGILFNAANPQKAYAGFGISPSTIENETLKKGTKLVQDMVISRADPDEKMTAIIEPDLGELNDWVTFEPGPSIVMPKGEQRVPFKVIINIPSDAAIKNYDGVFRIYAEPDGQVKGVSVVEGARVDISLTTTEVSVVDLSIRAVKIPDTYVDEDLILELTTNNKGNSYSAPSKAVVEVESLNEEKIKILTTTNIEKAAPYQISKISAIFKDHGLPKGEYYGLVKIYDGSDVFYEDRVVFVVHPKRIYEEVCSGAPAIVANNRIAMFGGMSLLALGVALVVLKYNKGDKKRSKKDQKKLLIIVTTAFVLFEAIMLPVVYFNVFGLLDRECRDVQVNLEEEVAVAQENTPEPTSQVQGLSTKEEAKDTSIGGLNVSPEKQDGKYKIYQSDNLSSAVIYLAEEGEKLNVIEEKAQWYRVELEDGSTGWLPKQNVKETNVEER